MRKIVYIGLWVWICFIVEYFLSEWLPAWLRPNLLLLLVIFFNLYRGIRHSLLVSFFSGVIKDSFMSQMFGLNIFTFMACAYITTFLKMYIYESSSSISRLFLVFLVSLSCVLIAFWTRLMFVQVNFFDVLYYILIPEVFATTITALIILKIYKRCALKLFA